MTRLGSRKDWGAEALCPAPIGTVEVFRIRIMPWPQAAECNMITNKQNVTCEAWTWLRCEAEITTLFFLLHIAKS